jgi:small-conductance mechanosensitive channel
MHAISLYFFLKVTMEIVYVLVENNKKHDALDALINFNEIQKRMRSLLVVIGVIFWFMILLHNLALNNYFNDSLGQFLSKERMLGNTPYSFGAILLFAGLIYGSSILANNVAYFFSIKDQKAGDTRAKKLGSSVLIIRLGVLTLGFFIAATAAKIPLDKITIVLGALSVGIGFGLQTIINNLVSGLILAFERPIQIGDDIEVGTMSGKVKEVGIRASKILAYDGSEIIVPNGDLLSQSLINWTLSDQKRRVELLIGVAYTSDMALVKKLMEDVLNQARILKYPAPKILMQNFGESSVDFRLLFWVESMDIYIDVRNEVMQALFETFHVHGIEIPFPKRDLYVKELPEDFARPNEQKKSPES